MPEVIKEVVTGAVDSTITLSKVSTSAQSTLTQFDRGRRITVLVKPPSQLSDVADWTRCLSAGLYNAAAKSWNEDNVKGGLMLIKRCCEMSSYLLDLINEAGLEGDVWTAVVGMIAKRDELLAGSAWKMGEKEVNRDKSIVQDERLTPGRYRRMVRRTGTHCATFHREVAKCPRIARRHICISARYRRHCQSLSRGSRSGTINLTGTSERMSGQALSSATPRSRSCH